jgi:hypothetical protein
MKLGWFFGLFVLAIGFLVNLGLKSTYEYILDYSILDFRLFLNISLFWFFTHAILLLITFSIIYSNHLFPRGLLDVPDYPLILLCSYILIFALILVFVIILALDIRIVLLIFPVSFFSMLVAVDLGIRFDRVVEERGVEKKPKEILIGSTGGVKTYLVEERGRKLVKKCFREADAELKKVIRRAISYWISMQNLRGVQKIVRLEMEEDCIYLEFVPGKTLREFLNEVGYLEGKEACRIALQIAQILHEVFKETGLIHRDLKPENVVLGEKLVILDWMFAAKVGDPFTPVGTVGYSPPDKLLGEKYDVYSLGIMLNEMITGARLGSGVFKGSERIKNLIDRMIEKPETRISLDESLRELKELIS